MKILNTITLFLIGITFCILGDCGRTLAAEGEIDSLLRQGIKIKQDITDYGDKYGVRESKVDNNQCPSSQASFAGERISFLVFNKDAFKTLIRHYEKAIQTAQQTGKTIYHFVPTNWGDYEKGDSIKYVDQYLRAVNWLLNAEKTINENHQNEAIHNLEEMSSSFRSLMLRLEALQTQMSLTQLTLFNKLHIWGHLSEAQFLFYQAPSEAIDFHFKGAFCGYHECQSGWILIANEHKEAKEALSKIHFEGNKFSPSSTKLISFMP